VDDPLPKLTWPDVPRIAFGSDRLDGRLNARVGWVLSNARDMTGYIVGYKDAAEALSPTSSSSRLPSCGATPSSCR
jgi:hypothetical protein